MTDPSQPDNVTQPDNLSVVPAALRAHHTDPAPGMLVLPGGGYRAHAPHESEVVAHWLSGAGIHAFVLRYPVRSEPTEEPLFPDTVEAATAAMAWIRSGAHGLSVSDRVGVMGFSAGGHLAASLCHADRLIGASADLLPDFAVLGYPVISLGHQSHPGSRDRLLGLDADPAEITRHSIETQVHAATPPTFLWHTANDEGVPVSNSLRYAQALADQGVPVELHVFPDGLHGLGLAPRDPGPRQWLTLCERWLATVTG